MVVVRGGQVCLNLPEGSGRAEQKAYFEVALERIGVPGDLVNKVLEIDPGPQGERIVIARLYDFPEHSD